jgi:hypothetical protein
MNLVRPNPIETQAGSRYANVAVLTDRPAGLGRLQQPLRQLAPHADAVHVWLGVERFRAPSSTHPPYRVLARAEARNITAERLLQAAAGAREAVATWAADIATPDIAAILDPTTADIIARIVAAEIDLLVCDADSGVVALAERAASQTGRPLLLVPAADDDLARTTQTRSRTNPAARLLRALHG